MAAREPMPRGLPEVYRRIANRCGMRLALALARRLGGRRITLPSHQMTERHVLVQTFGATKARIIAAALEPGTVDLPTARAALGRYDAVRLRRRGVRIAEIARRLKVSERWAKKLVAGVRPGTGSADVGEEEVCVECGRRHRRPKRRDPAPLPLFERLQPKKEDDVPWEQHATDN